MYVRYVISVVGSVVGTWQSAVEQQQQAEQWQAGHVLALGINRRPGLTRH